ncbi:hypothetical protein ABT380_37990, partial [Streptomyces lydicus]
MSDDDAERADTRPMPTLEKEAGGPDGGTRPASGDTPEPVAADGRTGRFWSARRVPAAVAALVLLG